MSARPEPTRPRCSAHLCLADGELLVVLVTADVPGLEDLIVEVRACHRHYDHLRPVFADRGPWSTGELHPSGPADYQRRRVAT